MSEEIKDLLSYAIKTKDSLAKKIAFVIIKYSSDLESVKLANQLLSESVNIDLWELESLINPQKFEFPEPNIGQVNIENEEDI